MDKNNYISANAKDPVLYDPKFLIFSTLLETCFCIKKVPVRLRLIQNAFLGDLTCYEVSCLKIWLFACWAKFPRRGWCMDSIHLAQLETKSLNILPYLGIKGVQLGMKANHVRCRLKTVSHSGELLQKWNTFHLTHSWSGLEYKHLHWLKYLQPACSFIALLFWEKLQWICIPFTNSVGKSTLDQFVELSVGEDSF